MLRFAAASVRSFNIHKLVTVDAYNALHRVEWIFMRLTSWSCTARLCPWLVRARSGVVPPCAFLANSKKTLLIMRSNPPSISPNEFAGETKTYIFSFKHLQNRGGSIATGARRWKNCDGKFRGMRVWVLRQIFAKRV